MIPKILSIDDSKTVRMIIKKMLCDFNCELLEAADGFEGLTLSQKEKPDLIILDIDMPRMNGLDMLRILRSDGIDKHAPVFMVTSKSNTKNVKIALQLGVAAFIAKPFKREELIEKIIKVVPLTPK